jgi:hypothetical protein
VGAPFINDDVRHCREETCRAKIVFAVTPAGKRVPIDVEPNPEGRYYLVAWEPPQYWLGPAAEAEPDDLRYTSHFETCSAPGRFTRNKPKGNRDK